MLLPTAKNFIRPDGTGEPGQPASRPQQGRLERVFRVVHRTEHAIRVRAELRPVGRDQAAKRVLVTRERGVEISPIRGSRGRGLYIRTLSGLRAV
jgi:hypothetical protein